jgi:HEAT repeat protein
MPKWKEWLHNAGLAYPATDLEEALLLLEGEPAAVPVLLDLLRSTDPVVRKAAAEGLGAVGGPARVATPRLTPLLGDGDEPVRLAARAALKKIDPDALAAHDRDRPGAWPDSQ